jgi:hypothetical protein
MGVQDNDKYNLIQTSSSPSNRDIYIISKTMKSKI